MKVARLFVLSAMAVFTASLAFADPQLSLLWIGGNGSDGCQFYGDGLILTISDHGRQIVKKHLCSAYGKGDARIVKDTLGHHYVMLNYAEGHGTHNTIDRLAIYRLTDRLIDIDDIDVSEPDGLFSWWSYDNTLEYPANGGLRINFTLRLHGNPDAGTPLPPRTQTINVAP